MAVSKPMFEIVVRDEIGQWVNDRVGDPNTFTSEDEARTVIAELRTLGPDWLNAEYDVRDAE